MAHSQSNSRRPPYLNALLFGIGVMLFQLVVATIANHAQYRHLCYWDCGWYGHILENGYRTTIPPTKQNGDLSNVGFFPGFPIWASAFKGLLHLDMQQSMIISAQAACAGFWTYVYLALVFFEVSVPVIALLTLSFLVQPGAFILITGFSEPLFLFTLMGFLYWCSRGARNPMFFILAAVHGALHTSTRIVGMVVAVFPMILLCIENWKGRFPDFRRILSNLSVPASLSMLAGSGMLAFLAYCQIRFGQWNVYWDAQKIGWGTYVDLSRLLTPSFYTHTYLTGSFPDVLGRVLTPFVAALTGALTLWAWRRKLGNPLLAAWAILASLLFIETVAGRTGADMIGMIRYLLPVYAVTLPLCGRWIESRIQIGTARNWLRPQILFPAACLALLFFAIEVEFIIRFSNNEWVA
jgi:hypothetical protein